jgi:hypothetical protein
MSALATELCCFAKGCLQRSAVFTATSNGVVLAAELSRSVGAATTIKLPKPVFEVAFRAVAPTPLNTRAFSVERVVASSIEAWPACHNSAATARDRGKRNSIRSGAEPGPCPDDRRSQ